MENIFMQSETREDERVSYWLEKLYQQREEKIRRYPPEIQGVRTLEDEGKDEHARHQATKKEEDRQTVNDLVSKSNRRIISISSLFPWDLFPNTINVEEGRVTFIFRQLLSSQSHSIEIKNISNVFIESSLFFAAIEVVSHTYVQNEIRIGHLDRKKANNVQRIIEGLRTFEKHNINTSNYEIDELLAKIDEFHINQTVS